MSASDIALRVESLGKMYRLGREVPPAKTVGGKVLRAVASPFDWLASQMRDPTEEEILWALKDVSFEIKRGEVVGVIGRNGAGKSTLLKILSRITEPTEGYAEIHGRIGALLEVGTGMHQELTGRENIYMNGTVLGMKKREIDRCFDEIIDFSGIEKFLDTPVKRYSSGMRVRLGFAIAAHLEPEILIVDEVLAVGDADFQKKCLGKMQDVAGRGRTVLFVSHNMATMQRLCERGILLADGGLVDSGDMATVINGYLGGSASFKTRFEFAAEQHRIKSPFQITELELILPDGRSDFLFGEPVVVELGVKCSGDVRQARIGVGLIRDGVRVCTVHSEALDYVGATRETIRCIFPANFILPGFYSLAVGAHQAGNGKGLDYITFEMPLKVNDVAVDAASQHDRSDLGLVRAEASWQRMSPKGDPKTTIV